jgi:hypothetical protein
MCCAQTWMPGVDHHHLRHIGVLGRSLINRHLQEARLEESRRQLCPSCWMLTIELL